MCKHQKLMNSVMEKSNTTSWHTAVKEWEVTGCRQDKQSKTKCVCGQEGLRYIYTIKNKTTGERICSIGSSCIKLFKDKNLDESAQYFMDKYTLLEIIQNNQFITLSNEYFSRKLLHNLYIEGAFPQTKYNKFNGEEDYRFILKMFNKRDKTKITDAQKRKITAILLNSIKPFLLKNSI